MSKEYALAVSANGDASLGKELGLARADENYSTATSGVKFNPKDPNGHGDARGSGLAKQRERQKKRQRGEESSSDDNDYFEMGIGPHSQNVVSVDSSSKSGAEVPSLVEGERPAKRQRIQPPQNANKDNASSRDQKPLNKQKRRRRTWKKLPDTSDQTISGANEKDQFINAENSGFLEDSANQYSEGEAVNDWRPSETSIFDTFQTINLPGPDSLRTRRLRVALSVLFHGWSPSHNEESVDALQESILSFLKECGTLETYLNLLAHVEPHAED
jgi:hypothetical protein